jgi:hypothetical protein
MSFYPELSPSRHVPTYITKTVRIVTLCIHRIRTGRENGGYAQYLTMSENHPFAGLYNYNSGLSFQP